MSFARLLSNDHIATLHTWLNATSELYVCHHLVNVGFGPSYRVNRLADVKEFLAGVEWPGLEVWFYRQLQFPVRGVADDALLERVLAAVPNGSDYEMCALDDYFPRECGLLGSGDSHDQIRADIDAARGRLVAIGPDPRAGKQGDDDWVYKHPDDVLYLSFRTNDYERRSEWSREELSEALSVWEGKSNNAIESDGAEPS